VRGIGWPLIEPDRLIRQSLTTCLIAFCACGAEAQGPEAFFTFNQSPLIQFTGLPAINSAQVLNEGAQRYRLITDLANNFAPSRTSREKVLLDGETLRTTLAWSRGLGHNWEWGVEIPVIRHSGGILDSFIEDWHSFFRLPEGGRPKYPQDKLSYYYVRDGETRILLTEPTTGLGDIRLNTAWQWRQIPTVEHVAVRAQLSLPTGDSDHLQGLGDPSLALWLSAQNGKHWWRFPGSWFGGGGLLLMPKGDVLPQQQRPLVVFASLGAGVRVLPGMNLKLQLDGHSPFYSGSVVDEVGRGSLQLVMGGDIVFSKRWRLELGVSEDAVVETSPDVVLHAAVTWTP
jgi:hypothetical protein